MNILSTMFSSSRAPTCPIRSPFNKNSVETIYHIVQKRYDGTVRFRADIHFQAGRTKGEHTVEGTDMQDLLTKTYALLETLN